MFDSETDRSYWNNKRQAEEHEERYDLLGRIDVGHVQTTVIAAVARVHRLENVCQLQKVQTNH